MANQMVEQVYACKSKEYEACAKEFAKNSKFVIIPTLDDGNCFFDTLSKAASHYHVPRLAHTHQALRAQLVGYMLDNIDDVISFFVMNSNNNSNNSNNNENDFKTPEERIISLGEDGVWDNKDGDTISQIASQAFNININLYDVKEQIIKKKKSFIVNKIRLHIDQPTHEINILRINDGHYELLDIARNVNRNSRKAKSNAAAARSKSRSRSRSKSGSPTKKNKSSNANMIALNGMNEAEIQKSRVFTIDKLKEVLRRMGVTENDLKGMKKPDLIQEYKIIRGTKKNINAALAASLKNVKL